MPSTYRHSVRELIARYRLEPTLRDLYVEGTTDVTLFNWFFAQLKIEGVKVYPINVVRIENPFPVENGGGGEKGDAIGLALALASAIPQARNVRCIVDKDIFGISVAPPVCSVLLVTDHSSLESYAFAQPSLSKLFQLYFQLALSKRLLDSALATLNAVFILRAAKFELSLAAHWIENFTRSTTVNQDEVVFDENDFIDKLVGSSAGRYSREQMCAKRDEIRARGLAALDGIHKRDALQLLGWYGREMGLGNNLTHEIPLARALFLSLELATITGFPLFVSLAGWAV